MIPILTDSYKVSHYKQYPPGTTHVFSFLEARGGYAQETCFFGLQYFLKRYLAEGIYLRDVFEAADLYEAHFGNPQLFNRGGFTRLITKHRGRLPLEIKAVPEGTVVPTGNVLMTVENTDAEFPWLTNWVEGLLSQVWYPMSVATQSRLMKRTILDFLERNGDPAGVDFKLHDFGFRGSTSPESAAIGGAAHLVNFKGTDTVPALRLLSDYYGEYCAGFSIPAAEHSTITAWGKNGELDAYKNMLDQFPTGLVAIVGDSYDIFKACSDYFGGALRDQIVSRDGTVVVRPDSGDPAPTVVKVLNTLGAKFGFEVNAKGYKVLPPQVRVIQGDGINRTSLFDILELMDLNGWSADNIAFGSGGGLLQNVNRDTHKVAFKCSAARVGDSWRDVIKDPVTDPGKRSKAGRLMLYKREAGGFYTEAIEPEQHQRDEQLQTVFLNGHLLGEQSLADIRQRALW